MSEDEDEDTLLLEKNERGGEELPPELLPVPTAVAVLLPPVGEVVPPGKTPGV